MNVALNRPSYQISTYTSNAGLVRYSSYANDGNHDTDIVNLSCMMTDDETNPWWAVDLGVALYVYGVKFTNRDYKGMWAMLILERRVVRKIYNPREGSFRFYPFLLPSFPFFLLFQPSKTRVRKSRLYVCGRYPALSK